MASLRKRGKMYYASSYSEEIQTMLNALSGRLLKGHCGPVFRW